ncbi:MAG TPA: outer membrane beta-barrel protein [Isosphaeraceae bacterium]|nr:outer membrane beta-barrel protein [Isosphaeraceae bacterium]
MFDPFRPVRVRAGGEGGEENEDTDLTRPRAERAGEGGGPTKAAEEDDDEDYPKSNLLVKVLGMEDSDTQLFGWVDGSFTANPSRPANGENFGVFPNNHANSWMFNQIYFVVEKKLDEEEDDEFGYGFRVDNLLGADWQVSHALGLFDHAFVLNRFGYDIPQFYGEIHLPVLTPGGVDIKAGRWYALPGYEDLAAPGRPLLSTTYMFSYAQPITQLGVMSTWHVNDQLNVYNGVTNGWDRWFNIHNGIGFAHAVAWDSKDGRTNLTMTFNVGPNQLQRFLPANFNVAPVAVTPPPFLAGRRNLSAPNSSAYLFTAVGTHEFTDDLTGIIEANLGWENNVAGAGFGGTSVNAAWYGLAGWTLYDFLDQLIGVARLEVFRDNNGFLTGFSDNFYEATLGMIYRPRSWLWARPEIRYDWAQFTRPYNDGNSKSQLTFGFDVIFLF